MVWPKTVDKTDLRIEFYRGSGPGGQNRNKRDTACRITHIPTGKQVTCQDERTQGANKKIAFKKLAKILVPLMLEHLKEKKEKVTEVIRTYNFSRNTVKDHRTGKIAPIKKFLDGDLDLLNGEGPGR